MKKTIIFLVIIALLSSTALAIYQEPFTAEAPPSRNIIVKKVMFNDGIIRDFGTGQAVTNVPRQSWTATGTSERQMESRRGINYPRRTSFQANLEFGTQAHAASISSQAKMNQWSILRQKNAGIPTIDRSGEQKIVSRRMQTGAAILPGEKREAQMPYEGKYPPLIPLQNRPTSPETSGYTDDIIEAGKQVEQAQRPHSRMQTGAAILPGEKREAQMPYEGNYPPLMPGEQRPYNIAESGLTRDQYNLNERMEMKELPHPRMQTGAVAGYEQSSKGENPFALGGAVKTRTAGMAYARGEKSLTERENPYALGGTGRQITAGQAQEIEDIIGQRRERARKLLAQMR